MTNRGLSLKLFFHFLHKPMQPIYSLSPVMGKVGIPDNFITDRHAIPQPIINSYNCHQSKNYNYRSYRPCHILIRFLIDKLRNNSWLEGETVPRRSTSSPYRLSKSEAEEKSFPWDGQRHRTVELSYFPGGPILFLESALFTRLVKRFSFAR